MHTIPGKRATTTLLAATAVAWLTACEPLTITALGVGASTAVGHTMTGITYRTFTAPMPRVRLASMNALNRMGLKFESSEKIENGELIKASANRRSIEIELEVLSPNATRMRVTARNGGVFYDSATSTEIIYQTERLLGNA